MNKIQKFRQGLRDLTTLQFAKSRATGSLWGAIGLSIAFLGMVYNMIFKTFTVTQLGFSIFVFFLVYMQIVQYIGAKQQIAAIKEAKDRASDIEILKGV